MHCRRRCWPSCSAQRRFCRGERYNNRDRGCSCPVMQPETTVFVRGVVPHKIHHKAHPARMDPLDHLLKIRHCAKGGVDGAIICHIVAAIRPRADEERTAPDHVYPQRSDIIEFGGDAGEIAHSVSVGITKTARIDLIDHRVLPPFRLPHKESHLPFDPAKSAAGSLFIIKVL